jgi:alpha-L-fucosidase
MRDPSIVRGPDGTWHLVWTTAWRDDLGFGYAHSKDLVHWSEQKFIPAMTNEPTTASVWAPELFYDDGSWRSSRGDEALSEVRRESEPPHVGSYIIVWASRIPGRFPGQPDMPENNHRMYFTTTRDFKSFTPTKLFLDPGFSVIDCKIIKDADRYVLLLKDNTRPICNIRVAFGDTPLGPWKDMSEAFTKPFTEGPCALNIGEDWLIYYDAYRARTYGAVRTRDFKTFTDVTDQMTFPPGLKHGTVFKATRRDLDRLLRIGAEQVPGIRLPLVSNLSPAEIDARLKAIEAVANRGPFKPDWDSIVKGFKTPKWYHDAKFGIFIHWGAYSVPAFGDEWYPRKMYVTNSPAFKHHVATYGPQSKFGYKDFIPVFKAEEFDARAWATLFKQAGAKYIVPVAEHHDGFPMYDSDLTEWSAAKKGPKRDVIGEQAKAYKKEGLVFCASSHRAEHWWFMDQGMYFDSDVRNPANSALYGPASNQRTAESQAEPPDKAYLDDWLLRCCEIVDKYQPQVFYFDWWIGQPVFQPYLKTFTAYYYNRGAEWKKQVAINFKDWEGESLPHGAGVFDIERGQSAEIRSNLWQTCNSVSKSSWGYVTNHNYKDVGGIVDDLIDIVSKNGTLLLNIGPKPDGTIPGHEQDMLREIGAWLRINGEAIYGTRPWKIFGEGPTQIVAGSFADTKRKAFTSTDFRFTTKGKTLYAIALAWPEDRRLIVTSLGNDCGFGAKVKEVRLLGHGGKLKWEQANIGLVVNLPEKPPCDHAVTLKITGLK